MMWIKNGVIAPESHAVAHRVVHCTFSIGNFNLKSRSDFSLFKGLYLSGPLHTYQLSSFDGSWVLSPIYIYRTSAGKQH